MTGAQLCPIATRSCSSDLGEPLGRFSDFSGGSLDPRRWIDHHEIQQSLSRHVGAKIVRQMGRQQSDNDEADGLDGVGEIVGHGSSSVVASTSTVGWNGAPVMACQPAGGVSSPSRAAGRDSLRAGGKVSRRSHKPAQLGSIPRPCNQLSEIRFGGFAWRSTSDWCPGQPEASQGGPPTCWGAPVMTHRSSVRATQQVSEFSQVSGLGRRRTHWPARLQVGLLKRCAEPPAGCEIRFGGWAMRLRVAPAGVSERRMQEPGSPSPFLPRTSSAGVAPGHRSLKFAASLSGVSVPGRFPASGFAHCQTSRCLLTQASPDDLPGRLRSAGRFFRARVM